MTNMQSAPTFKDSIETLTKTKNVGFYMIHLSRATERLPFIHKLEADLQTSLPLFEAADGPALVKEGHPTTCQQRGPPYTRGSGCVGCTVSHIRICKDALSKQYDYVVIFEDDTAFCSDLSTFHSEIQNFVNLNAPWDLFLLGWDPESASPIVGTSISKINRIFSSIKLNG